MFSIKKYPLEDLELKDCFDGAVPLVIQTPVEWKLDELADVLRTMRFSMYRFPHDVIACARQDADNSITTLDDFLARQEEYRADREHVYKVISNLEDSGFARLTALFSRLNEKFIAGANSDYRNLWVNFLGEGTGLHFDLPDAFNLQLIGEKTYHIAEPGSRGYYPFGWFGGKGHCSRIPDIQNIDEDRFPLFRHVGKKFRKVVLRQGEVMFMPSCWWHQVDSNKELNMNLTWGRIDYSGSVKHPRQTLSSVVTYIYRKVFYPHIY